MRAHALGEDQTLWVNDAGTFFTGSDQFLARFLTASLEQGDCDFLRDEGHWLEDADALAWAAHKRSVARRITVAGQLDYLILVPTLRCNLSCTYCQVSRVGVEQTAFDWSEATLSAVLDHVTQIEAPCLKIEFQGGEPTLRPDLIEAVIATAARVPGRQFVICTNLQEVSERVWKLFDRPDVFVSTSLDGAFTTHRRNRTAKDQRTAAFIENLRAVVDRYGPTKVSALPTVDPSAPPLPNELIESYAEFGFDSIFLRPINFQGFARKKHASSREQDIGWRAYYEQFVRALIAQNWTDRDRVLEETYLSVALRRIFRAGQDRHVDLRNPNPMGFDYIVADYDGTVYPTDESRMLTRSGVIDLSIGNVFDGWESEKRAQLNNHCSNQFDPDCVKCAFQPFCGRDVIDDLARYGQITMARHETEFCRKHLHLFDFVFRLLYEDDPAVRYSLARWLRLPSTPDSFGPHLQ